jgi:iron complex outermembrane receptor protein
LCSDPGQPSPVDPAFPLNRLGDRVYLDLQAAWEAPALGRFALGLRNVLDRDPPVSYAGTANSFDPAYPIPGRFWHLSWSRRW